MLRKTYCIPQNEKPSCFRPSVRIPRRNRYRFASRNMSHHANYINRHALNNKDEFQEQFAMGYNGAEDSMSVDSVNELPANDDAQFSDQHLSDNDGLLDLDDFQENEGIVYEDDIQDDPPLMNDFEGEETRWEISRLKALSGAVATHH